jgi:ABC-type transport system substrate-binding protein
MRTDTSTGAKLWLRGSVGLVLLALVMGPLMLAGSQPGKDKPKPGKRTEEEDESRTPSKRIQDPEEDQTGPQTPAATGDLALALRQARHPRVHSLLTKVAVPHDLVIFRGEAGRQQWIRPIAPFIGANVPKLPRDFKAVPLDEQGKPDKPITLRPGGVKEIQPYEKLAQEAVSRFLAEKLYNLKPTDAHYMSPYDQLVAAEQVLQAVIAFHESARQLGQRTGEEWAAVMNGKEGLRQQLLEVLFKELETLLEQREWDTALALGRRLGRTYTQVDEQLRIATLLSKVLKGAMDSPQASRDKMRDARLWLRDVIKQNPGKEDFKRIGLELQEQAEELFKLAKAAKAKEQFAQAEDFSRQAVEIWPQLPQLLAFQRDLLGKHRILRVGVRQLPHWMSPGLACTDSDRRAVELLFESLVKASVDADGLERYQPGLAIGRPLTLSLGRQFQLPHNVFWSNGQPLTTADIRYTVKLLREGVAIGRPRAYGEMLDEVLLGGDPLRVTVPLKQGYIDPLSLMTFKILPQPSVLGKEIKPDDEPFARDPIGSGPFRFNGFGGGEKGQLKFASFTASLNYGSRAGKTGLPRISEVLFLEYTDPVNDLKQTKFHLMLDLTAEEALAIRQQGGPMTVPEPSGTNRRVFFLAVNHRRGLLKYRDLRSALARAINRESILNLIRRQLGPGFHRAINSPYPANTWPLNPDHRGRAVDKSLDLHDPDLARSLIADFKKDQNITRPIRLSLKFPKEQPGTETIQKAMEDIKQKVQSLLGITLELEECEPDRLRKDVETAPFDYDLAYYSYEFPDETYWLWPLLGQRGLPDGGNYLGYDNPRAEGELMSIRGSCDFVQVRTIAQRLHRDHLLQDMPVIPLWQLDPVYAIHKDLKMPLREALRDPWQVFTDVELWQLEGQ